MGAGGPRADISHKTARAGIRPETERERGPLRTEVLCRPPRSRRAVKAAVLRGPGGLCVEDVPVPEAGPGEIVVSMRACGLCGSDLEKIRGTYTAAPPVIGHEAVGIVSEVGEGVEGIQEGARVFPHHHVPCGRGPRGEGGRPTVCADCGAT